MGIGINLAFIIVPATTEIGIDDFYYGVYVAYTQIQNIKHSKCLVWYEVVQEYEDNCEPPAQPEQ